MIITLDGPAASGKSSAAEMLAQKLHIYYLNSGLLYRALAYLLLKKGYTVEQLNHLLLSDVVYYTDPLKLTYSYSPKTGAQVRFNGEAITPYLKETAVDTASSVISSNGYVRSQIHRLQRTIAEHKSLVIEGRDAGSVVFPDANYKFFLTAPIAIRAERWRQQQQKKGNLYSAAEAIEHVRNRDERDAKRKIAPLSIPIGAEIIDNEGLTIDATVALLRDMMRKK